MKVRIIHKAGYGPRVGDYLPHDAVVELDDALAAKLIVHRLAVPVGEDPPVKRSITTTAIAPSENASKPKARPRRKG